MGAHRSETSELTVAKATSGLLAWPQGFAMFLKSPMGDTEGSRQMLCMQWLCTKVKSSEFGIVTAFIVNRGKPTLFKGSHPVPPAGGSLQAVLTSDTHVQSGQGFAFLL